MRTIAIIAALDTKGQEAGFLHEEIEKRGQKSLVIDIGMIGKPRFEPGISRYQVARAAGSSIRRLIKADNRAAAVETMAAGARSIVGKPLAAPG